MTINPQTYQFTPFSAIKPSGWIRAQMQHDLEHGFVGHLDELVPDLIQRDDIYGADRDGEDRRIRTSAHTAYRS